MEMLATDTRRLRFAALAMRIANVALFGLVLFLVVGLVRQLTRQPLEEAAFTPSSSVETAPAPNDLNVLVASLPFAAAEDVEFESDKPKAVQQARQASEDYELLGTVAGDDRTARAIILDKKNKSQSVYKIGDVVTGARIDQIERLRVSLTRNGRREILETERELSLRADRL